MYDLDCIRCHARVVSPILAFVLVPEGLQEILGASPYPQDRHGVARVWPC